MRVRNSGATIDDVARLEKMLEIPIILREIAGEDIYKNEEVHIYEGDVWQAIREATRGEPLAVWLLGGQDRQFSVDQFVLQDGRTYRTQNPVIEDCKAPIVLVVEHSGQLWLSDFV